MTPHDPDLEASIIGTCLVFKRVPVNARRIVPTDFFVGEYKRIWAAIMALDEDSKPLDVFDIAEKVEGVKVTDIVNLTRGVPMLDIRAEDVSRLKDLASLRHLTRSFNQLALKAQAQEPILDILDEARSLIDGLASEMDARVGTSQSIVEVMENEVFPRLDKFVSGEMVKVPFGFDALDSSTNGGASLGELVVMGARPKQGKSAFLLQTARQTAARGLPTLIASLEMLNYENGFRFLAQSSQFSVNVFRPDMRDFVADRLKEHAREHYQLPLRFDQKARTIQGLSNEIRRLKGEFGLTCAFVDYVQLIRSEKRNVSRTEKIEEAIYDLKELAMKHEIVVYTAAQFNREGIKADRPTLAHFDGSSAIEKAANLALFWQLEQDTDLELQGRKGQLWIEVGRSVACDSFDLVFYGKQSKFEVSRI